MKKKIYYFLHSIFENYFWLVTITAILDLFLGIGWLTTLVLPIVIYYCVFAKPFHDSRNSLDYLWGLMLLWMVLTWTYNDYSNKEILSIRCFFGQIAYMMTYWIARKSDINYIALIIKRAYLPLVITCIIGIYCFFVRPEWYADLISQSLNKMHGTITESMILEANRLRSIFSSPYVLAYFCAFVIIYESFYINNRFVNLKYHYALIALMIVTSILAMQRAPFVCSLIGFVCALFYSFLYIKGKVFLWTNMLVVLIIGFLMLSFIIANMNSATSEYLNTKVSTVVDTSDEFVSDRFYLNQRNESDWFGDGVGRHDIMADKYNPGSSMRDGEYMKILQEQGYIGMGLFVLFAFLAMYKSVVNFKKLSLELCLLIMLLICMIGANPLSTIDKHSVFFWLAFGQISRLKK